VTLCRWTKRGEGLRAWEYPDFVDVFVNKGGNLALPICEYFCVIGHVVMIERLVIRAVLVM
jgi:hypothetical protein